MIELEKQDLRSFARQSSKGNQLKWERDGIWYKADYAGYEGFSEYVVSKLLACSSLCEEEYVSYDTEIIRFGEQTLNGCKSENFLGEDEQLITLERLYFQKTGRSLYRDVFALTDLTDRLRFLVDKVTSITGLSGFGTYIGKLLTIDAVFLNEDRHFHNIALKMGRNGRFTLCPVFDHGAALLSDTTLDYPLGEADAIYEQIACVHAKTVSQDFREQLETGEQLFGSTMQFYFENHDLEKIVFEEPYYPEQIKDRVYRILLEQKRKYQYLWK